MHGFLLASIRCREFGEALASEVVEAIARIEDWRPLYVRGDVTGGEGVADEARTHLGVIRSLTLAT